MYGRIPCAAKICQVRAAVVVEWVYLETRSANSHAVRFLNVKLNTRCCKHAIVSGWLLVRTLCRRRLKKREDVEHVWRSVVS